MTSHEYEGYPRRVLRNIGTETLQLLFWLRVCINNVEKNDFQIYIYVRLELCFSTYVYSHGLMVRVVDLRLRVRGLLESASWPCVCAQVKDGSHIVIWTACKITLDQ